MSSLTLLNSNKHSELMYIIMFTYAEGNQSKKLSCFKTVFVSKDTEKKGRRVSRFFNWTAEQLKAINASMITCEVHVSYVRGFEVGRRNKSKDSENVDMAH